MIFLILILLFSPLAIQGYELVWRTNFENEEGYGYNGDELYLPTNEWSIDLRGTSIDNTSYMVEDDCLTGRAFYCSSHLGSNQQGIIWQSREISLNNNQDYYCIFHFGTSDNWDLGTEGLLCDFIKLGYYDDEQNYHLIYFKDGKSDRCKISAIISNTTSCRITVEVDCTAQSEVFSLFSVVLCSDTCLGDSSELIISKLCSPDYFSRNEKYFQITNVGDHLINLADYELEAIHTNRVLNNWDLTGMILPRETLIIGDIDARTFTCQIGNSTWSSRNVVWQGIPSYNDGVLIIRSNTREVTDRVVGINFNNGFAERDYTTLLASSETDPSSWSYQEVTSAAESSPGEFDYEQTLPVSLLTTNFVLANDGYLFKWTTEEESDLIGYNIYFSLNQYIREACKINSQIIYAHNSVQTNDYEYSLAEIDNSGYLWLEVLSIDQTNSFSDPIYFNKTFSQDDPEINNLITPLKLSIYPNPFSGQAFLEIKNNNQEAKKILLYNIKGQLVGNIKPQVTNNKYCLGKTMEHLPSGIYFLQVDFNDSKIIKKLILTK